MAETESSGTSAPAQQQPAPPTGEPQETLTEEEMKQKNPIGYTVDDAPDAERAAAEQKDAPNE